MSQIYKSVSGSPAVATSYVTDSGTAVPAANILNVLGTDGVITSGTGNTLTISLESANNASGQTVGAQSVAITTFDMGATAGTYAFRISVAAFVSSGTDAGEGAGYFFTGACRTDGATATLIGTEDSFKVEDASLVTADATLAVSGNDIRVEVDGVIGDTIEWKVFINGVFVTA